MFSNKLVAKCWLHQEKSRGYNTCILEQKLGQPVQELEGKFREIRPDLGLKPTTVTNQYSLAVLQPS